MSALTGTALQAELRRLALQAVLDDHYVQRPEARPHVAEVALFLAEAQKLPNAMGDDVEPETLLATTVGHLAIGGSAA